MSIEDGRIIYGSSSVNPLSGVAPRPVPGRLVLERSDTELVGRIEPRLPYSRPNADRSNRMAHRPLPRSRFTTVLLY